MPVQTVPLPLHVEFAPVHRAPAVHRAFCSVQTTPDPLQTFNLVSDPQEEIVESFQRALIELPMRTVYLLDGVKVWVGLKTT